MKSKKQFLIFISLISAVAIFQGCVQKEANGTYPSTYSYHPYNNMSHDEYLSYQQPKNITNPTTLRTRYQNVTHTLNQYHPYHYQRLPNQRNHSNLIANQIEKIAKSHLGQKYVWGANGPYTFDCSGFTKSVFNNIGISIPRVSKEQAKVGQYISKNQLKKGDLVFFDSPKSSEVSHVGIYLGNGKFIHASSAKKSVVIGNLNSGYHSKHFKWGRRLKAIDYIYARR